MNIEQLKLEKKKRKMTLQQISDLSGIPKRTVDDIFSWHTTNPRIDTIKAIENALGIQPHWTSEEVKAGVGDHPVTLSQEEKEILALFDELERIKGTAYKNAILDLIRSVIYAENKKN